MLGNAGTVLLFHDPLNRLLSVTEPGGKTTAYTYDAAGNRAAETVTAGGVSVTTGYAYDGLNRLVNTEKALADGSTEVVSYTYDNNGNMLSQLHSTTATDIGLTPALGLYQLGVDSPAADAIYEYDTRNQLIKVSQGSHIVECTYSGEGLRVSKTADGQTLRYLYEYDKIVLETNRTGNETAHNVYGTNLVSRTAAGETLYMYRGNAGTVLLFHDPLNRLLSVTEPGGKITAYTYDTAGTALQKRGTVLLFHDPLNRLLSVTEPGGKITSYTYDAAGNRATEILRAGGVSVTTGYVYDGLNRLVNTEKALADGSTETVSYTSAPSSATKQGMRDLTHFKFKTK